MHKNPAFFFLIVSIFFFLSFTFPKHSFADRLYQCSPAIAYAPVTELFSANCEPSALPVDCMTPQGTKASLPSGDKCADNARLYYSEQEHKTITAKCVEKCIATSLLAICPRDSRDGCFLMDLNNCTEKLNPPTIGDATFCIEYTEVTPTPTPIPPTATPTPIPPTNTPTPIPSCSSFATCASCIVNPSCGWGGVVVYSCQSGTSSCPASYTLWNWTSCTTNECTVPTPTPTPIPPTPTLPPGKSRIDGNVYTDCNENGAKDIGELDYNGATITLIEIAATTTSDVSGNYSFLNLDPGTFTVKITVPAGYKVTAPFGGTKTSILPPNDTVNFGIVPIAGCAAATPTPTPTPTPLPVTCNSVCSGISCTQTSGAPGSYQYIYVQSGTSCSLDSTVCVGNPPCVVPPTPTPIPPTATPTPTPIPPCPAGFREKIVTVTGGGADRTDCLGAGGACAAPGALPCCPPGACLASYSGAACSGSAPSTEYGVTETVTCGKLTTSAYTSPNNIPVNHTFDGVCGNNISVTTRYATLGFSGFNIPKGTVLKSAILSSPTSGGCEAAFVNNSTSVRFGANALIKSTKNFGCVFPGEQFYCGGCNKAIYDCGTSPTSSKGQANVTNTIQTILNTQDFTSVALSLYPDYHDAFCFASGSGDTQTSSFLANVGGPASLTIDYCEPLYSISGNVFEDTNKNQLKDVGELNYTAGVSTIGIHTGNDVLCSAATIYVTPTPFPTPTPVPPAPSCVGLGNSCGGVTPCCSPLVCTTTCGYSGCISACTGVPAPTQTPTPTPTPPPPTPTPTPNTTGIYDTGKILPAGQYTMCYTSLPISYSMTFPTNGPPANFNVIVGPSCSPGTSNSATCGIPPTPTPTSVPGCVGAGSDCSISTCCSGLTCNTSCGYTGCSSICGTAGVPAPDKNIYNANFGIGKDTHSISGNIFLDDNKNKIKDGTEKNYTGAVSTVEIHTGKDTCLAATLQTTLNKDASGIYNTGLTLTSGDYTVCYTSKPSGYVQTFPPSAIPPAFFTVTVGSSCLAPTISAIKAGTCDAKGNISSLNFGITNSLPWIQSNALDIRIDAGVNDTVPKDNFASIGTIPGIIFSGKLDPFFGQGQASESKYNWAVGGAVAPYLDTYTPTHHLVTTSYNYNLGIAQDNNLPTTDLAPKCAKGLTNCTLPASLAHDLYKADGNLFLNSYTFPTNQNYVILVNGDLHIKGNIKVPNGSTATFSVSGSIYVDKNVGEIVASSTLSNIEGFYSADKNFIVESGNIVSGINDCTIGADKRLNIAGSVVVNAGLLGGTFQNNRDICGGDVNSPTVYFSGRTDFILNAPRFILNTQSVTREVPPK